jgi:hypothetical protein
MDGWDFFIPSLGLFIGLNLITSCLGIRRMRLLERRIFALENAPAAQAVSSSATTQPTQSTSYTYVQPPVYTYYQQPSAPVAAPYYSQDPQVIPSSRNF